MEHKELASEILQKQLDCINEIYTKGFLSSDFRAWQMKSTIALESLFGSNSASVQSFKNISYSPTHENARLPELVKKKAFESGLEQAKAIILTCLKITDNYKHISDYSQKDAVQFIEDLCNRFNQIARKICTEYRGRKSLSINDEYDVQHLFHSLLFVKFDDIRPEDVNPNYAGATSRVDFLIKQEKIVVEVKKTRANLKDKEIGEQLIIDMKRYSQNQDCETLICFVYDPDQLILNPYGLERDLSGKHNNLEVKVIISPKS
ncbi:MAG TPA: hypothetical protein V6C84_06785 [Coleofasciculaceae cyanobacterium]|jgi:hypothetical protein